MADAERVTGGGGGVGLGLDGSWVSRSNYLFEYMLQCL